MRLFILGCLLLVVALHSCEPSCSENTAKKLMGDWYKKKILFDKNMKLINKGKVDPKYAFDISAPGRQFYVLHYFMADCDKCVYGLSHAREYIKKSEQEHPNLQYAFIASGPTSAYVEDAVAKLNFQFPVYFDSTYMGFKKANHFPEGDDVYNTMLLNNKNEVELFGAYYDNSKAASLFSEIVNCPL